MHQLAYELRDTSKSVHSVCKLVDDYDVSQTCLKILHVRKLNFSSVGGGVVVDAPETFQRKSKVGGDGKDKFLKAANDLLSVCKGALKNRGQREDFGPFDPSSTGPGRKKRGKPSNVNQEPSLRELKRRKSNVSEPISAFGSSAAGPSRPMAIADQAREVRDDDHNLGGYDSDSRSDGDPSDASNDAESELHGDSHTADVQRQWLRSLDLEDPNGDIGRDDADVDPRDPSATITQSTSGRVTRISYMYEKGDGTVVSSSSPIPQKQALGSVSILHAGSRRETLKVQCFLHSKCQIFRPMNKQKPGVSIDERARQWLVHGWHNYRFRNEGAKHMADAPKFFDCD